MEDPVRGRAGLVVLGAAALFGAAAEDARAHFGLLSPTALILVLAISLFLTARSTFLLARSRRASRARPARKDTGVAPRSHAALTAQDDRPLWSIAAAGALSLAATSMAASALIYHQREAAIEASWRDVEEGRLVERARHVREEFAEAMTSVEAPIRRAHDLAERNPRSGAPTGPGRAFEIVEGLVDSGAARNDHIAVSLYGRDQRILAWAGPCGDLPGELLVRFIPEGATVWAMIESDGLSRVVALARPWRGSTVVLVSERVLKSIYDRRVLLSIISGKALHPDSDRAHFSDFRKPPVTLASLFTQEGDLLSGPEAGRPLVHVALRAGDGTFLGHATLAGAAPASLQADVEDRHLEFAAWIVIGTVAMIVGVSLLPRHGPEAFSLRREVVRQTTRLAGLWVLRFLLLRYSIPIRLGDTSLQDPGLFARAGYLGLLRSPQDALLTAFAVLATGLLLALAASRLLLNTAPASRRRAAGICLFGALTLAFVLGTFLPSEAWDLVHNARVDVLTVRPLTPSPARIALQIAAAFALLGFVLPLATLAWGAAWAASPPSAGAPAPPVPTEETLRWVALVLAPCAVGSCAILELALQPAATLVLKRFLEDDLKPRVVAMPTLRRVDLKESIEAVKRYPALAERIAATDPEGDPTLAYDLWSATPAAAKGYGGSIAVGDAEDVLLSRFSVNFPLVFERENLEDRHPAEERITDFQAGTRRRTAMSLHVHTLIEGQMEPAGAVTIHLRNDFGDLPPLTPETPVQAALGERPLLTPLLEPWARTVGLVVYDRNGVPVPPSPRDPPPAPPEGDRERMLADFAEEYWRTRAAAGGRVHELFFGSAEHVVGLSFLEPGLTGRVARAIRQSAQTVACLIALMSPWALASALRLRWRLSPIRLLETLTRTHYRRLITTFLMASIAPLGLLAVGLTKYVTAEIEQHVSEQGWTILESARRQVEDFGVIEGVEGPPGHAFLFDLSEIVGGEEISLFIDGEMRATSNNELYAVGALPPRLDGEVYRKISVEGERAVLGRVEIGGRAYRTINGAVSLGLAGEGILSILLAGSRAEVEHRAQEVYDSLLITTASIVLFMSVLAYVLARRIAAPIRMLSAATARIAIGDLNAEVEAVPRDETGDLVASFNAMARALKKQRDELEQRGDYIEKILLNATTGVLSVDLRGRIVTINPAATAILGLPGLSAGQDVLARLAESPECATLLAAVRASLAPPSMPRNVEAELGPAGEERQARARIVPFTEGSGLLIFLDDVTETVRSNRLAAWAEMARRIAHEIKNPLTPIQLSADHLRRVFSDGSPAFPGVLEECLRTINEQVDNLREIAAQFSHYARLPEIRKEPTRMREFLEEVMRPYRAAPPEKVTIECDFDGDLPTLDVDRTLLAQAFVNLIENALQAMPEGGRLMVSAGIDSGDERALHVLIADTGVGMDRESLARAFEPYFSTKGSGTGLGMAIARRAVEEHRGRIELTSALHQGTTARIILPAA